MNKMRMFSSSVMAALVIVALFWGNCLSCPQVLLSVQSHQPSHDCCKRGQKPPVTKSCESQSLQNFVKSQAAPQVDIADAVIVAVATVAAMAPPSDLTEFHSEAAPAPPDLLSLHSSFRI